MVKVMYSRGWSVEAAERVLPDTGGDEGNSKVIAVKRYVFSHMALRGRKQ